MCAVSPLEINLKNRFQCWDVISHQDGIPKDRTFMSITARRIKCAKVTIVNLAVVIRYIPFKNYSGIYANVIYIEGNFYYFMPANWY